MSSDASRLERIEAEVARLRERVKHLETVENERQVSSDVFRSDLSRFDSELTRLRGSLGNPAKPTDGSAEDVSRLAREVEALKSWNQIVRFSMASTVVNDDLKSFLLNGDVGKVVNLPGSLSSEGLIGFLRGQSSKFEPRCVLSQSSCDLYSFVDPESSDFASTDNSSNINDNGWIFVEFRRSVIISEIEIQSSSKCFPRSFDLVLTRTDGEIVRKEIRDANLNGAKKRERYDVGEMSVRSLKLEPKGPNWEGRQYSDFQSLELFSKSGQFKSGVFNSLFREHRNEIRRHVCVTARDFDLSVVHSISPRTNVGTAGGVREWIEIDFVDQRLLINSYRLKRAPPMTLRSWSLVGSNDRTQGLDGWTRLDSRNESREGEFELFQVFDCFGGPFRYFRLVNDGPRWDGDTPLVFWHLDLFGVLFPGNVDK